MSATTGEDKKAKQAELTAALAPLKPFALNRLRFSFPSRYPDDYIRGCGRVGRAKLRKVLFWIKTPVVVEQRCTTGVWNEDLSVAHKLIQELKIWSELTHPNILPLLGYYMSRNLRDMWIASPLSKSGNLRDYLNNTNPSLRERLELAEDTARGLEYLHTLAPAVCHGDIRALNVVVDPHGHAKLYNFRLAKPTQDDSSPIQTKEIPDEAIRYCSPEILAKGNPRTLHSDIWAWGCLLLQIITSLLPYNDVVTDIQVTHLISEHILPVKLGEIECPSQIQELLSQCWELEPGNRPTITECLARITEAKDDCISNPPDPSVVEHSNADLDDLKRRLRNALVPFNQLGVQRTRLPPKIGPQIGRGPVYQTTMRGRLQLFGVRVAVKRLRIVGSEEKRVQIATASRTLARELGGLAGINHKHVAPLLGLDFGARLEDVWVVSPYMAFGNVSDYLERYSPTSDKKLQLALDTAMGLEYLHHKLRPPVCHGDIKPSNILITNERRAVLSDLGLAKSMDHMSTASATSTFDQRGTIPYESPELALGTSPRSLESDVWAWGCLAQEIITSRAPYHWSSQPGVIVNWITHNVHPAVLAEPECSADVRQFLVYCWQQDPATRPTMEQCVKAFSGDKTLFPSLWDELRRTKVTKVMNASVNIDSNGKMDGAIPIGKSWGKDEKLAQTVAVKRLVITSAPENSSRFKQILRTEVSKWAVLQHPNVLSLCGFKEDESLLAYPYLPSGNLGDYLKDSTFDEEQRLELAKDIAAGLAYLHSREIAHGNLHPRNILINERGRAVVSDYGLATVMDDAHAEFIAPNIASARYLSLDVLEGGNKTIKDDVWSLGSIILEILTRNVPHGEVEDTTTLVQLMNAGRLPADDINCVVRYQNMFMMCWKREAEARPPASEVLGILEGKEFWFENVRTIPADGSVFCLRLSRSGEDLAIAFQDRVEVYRTDDGKLMQKFAIPVECGNPNRIQYSQRRLVLGTQGGHVLVWDHQSADPCNNLSGHQNFVNDVDISSDETLVVSGSEDRTVRSWYLDGRVENNRTINTTRSVRSVAICPGSLIVAAGLYYGGVELIQVETGVTLASFGSGALVNSLYFPPQSSLLFEGSDQGVRKWDIKNPSEPCQLSRLDDGRAWHVSGSLQGSGVVLVDTSCQVRAVLDLPEWQSKPRTVGKLSDSKYPAHVDVSTISDEAAGIAVGLEGTKEVRLYKFARYDEPETYRIGRSSKGVLIE